MSVTQFEEDCYLGQFIPLQYHHHMLTDEYRMGTFKAAIDQAVFPGAKVLDLGGGTGVLSWFAAAKAGKVWCVEFNPDLVREARRLLKLNQGCEKIELVQADAFEYLPPEPVDVVICEMLHPAMVCEKQVNVIKSFKERYLQRFGGPLPRFIPEAVLMGVQPLQQNYRFMGFHAPIIQFQLPGGIHTDTMEFAPPQVYSPLDFMQPVSEEFNWEGVFTLEQAGQVNALRFITKSILSISTSDKSFIEWQNHYLVLPLADPVQAKAGALLHIGFNYRAGGSITHLQNSITATLE
ncbi:MAG: methyltransferase domain-containing protein [Methylobacter sp.]|jgi:predicted RNA methylase|nr:methyltransferase domain-containing protein [Methylobacter sp.]